jgi:cellulose biosynthesis protein BcsQ
MIISLINFKGGVGKTTSTILLSTLLKDKTLLVDASQESNLTAYYDLDPQVTSGHNLHSYLTKADTSAIMNISDTIDLIPGSLRTFQKDLMLKSLPQYPYVLIDTQPAFSVFVQSIVRISEAVLIPSDMDFWSFETALQVATQVRNHNKDAAIFILPTKYRFWRSSDRKLIAHFKELLPSVQGLSMLPPVRFVLSASNISRHEGRISRSLVKDYTRAWRELCDKYIKSRSTSQS